MKKLVVVIPAYNPPERMISYVDEIGKLDFLKIVVVNDGSENQFQFIFDQLQQRDDVIILNNRKNMGQGYSLKKAYKFILKQSYDCRGVITVDADGQHSVSDVEKLSKRFLEEPTVARLGVRNFNEKQVPLTRKFANNLTNFLFAHFYHKKISDTQSGLRVFPLKLLPELCKIPGDRFEYALMVLIDFAHNDRELREDEIQTIYHKGKKTSTFRPVQDSIRVYRMMWKGKRK
ncbi:MAG TPA: glycosyltransferase family 2 protein [Candidatus Fimihabitans intestinipullorum]|uniref:Glycosyltransferase family 2 protein n=1 Tax=Candidatus Fimihabitans intestinipullorum TaxID=2840820 RepID=A0A9D1L2G9_9BACT|nr:glycosyltransferase family 2 protein [Candidatus Fimihabitans intestinipullorum]